MPSCKAGNLFYKDGVNWLRNHIFGIWTTQLKEEAPPLKQYMGNPSYGVSSYVILSPFFQMQRNQKFVSIPVFKLLLPVDSDGSYSINKNLSLRGKISSWPVVQALQQIFQSKILWRFFYLHLFSAVYVIPSPSTCVNKSHQATSINQCLAYFLVSSMLTSHGEYQRNALSSRILLLLGEKSHFISHIRWLFYYGKYNLELTCSAPLPSLSRVKGSLKQKVLRWEKPKAKRICHDQGLVVNCRQSTIQQNIHPSLLA